jgi:hypothetical protein
MLLVWACNQTNKQTNEQTMGWAHLFGHIPSRIPFVLYGASIRLWSVRSEDAVQMYLEGEQARR